MKMSNLNEAKRLKEKYDKLKEMISLIEGESSRKYFLVSVKIKNIYMDEYVDDYVKLKNSSSLNAVLKCLKREFDKVVEQIEAL